MSVLVYSVLYMNLAEKVRKLFGRLFVATMLLDKSYKRNYDLLHLEVPEALNKSQ